jgi:hypothetical protein
MPMAAPTACLEPRCPRTAVERGRCTVHRRSTAQRGYGLPHQRQRAAAIAAYRPTDPCPRCGRPLGPDPDRLDLGHTDDRRGYNGLEHASCNRSARGNA